AGMVGAASNATATAAVRYFSSRGLQLVVIVMLRFSIGTVHRRIGSGGRGAVEAESRPSRDMTYRKRGATFGVGFGAGHNRVPNARTVRGLERRSAALDRRQTGCATRSSARACERGRLDGSPDRRPVGRYASEERCEAGPGIR